MKTPKIVMALLTLTVISLSSTQAFAWSSNRPEAPEAPISEPGAPIEEGDPSGQPTLQVCFADNSSGTTFRARGYNDQELIQGEAMRNCQIQSKEAGVDATTCRPLGCRAQ